MNKSWQRAWEQASVYLPVLLMALLALGTWWLVRQAPKPLLDTRKAVASADPDYIMERFSIEQFGPTGTLESVMTGQQARHFPLQDVFEVDAIHSRHWGPDGTITTSSAQRGISNADASEIQLIGDAKVRRQKPQNAQQDLQVSGDFLHIWPNEERTQSHLPVEIQRGSHQFTGDQMAYDNLSQVMELKGRVKGTIYPRAPQ